MTVKNLRPVQRRFCAWHEWLDGSQRETGKLIGISQVAVSMILSGETQMPTAPVLGKIEQESASWPDGPILMSEWFADPDQDGKQVPPNAESGSERGGL